MSWHKKISSLFLETFQNIINFSGKVLHLSSSQPTKFIHLKIKKFAFNLETELIGNDRKKSQSAWYFALDVLHNITVIRIFDCSDDFISKTA